VDCPDVERTISRSRAIDDAGAQAGNSRCPSPVLNKVILVNYKKGCQSPTHCP